MKTKHLTEKELDERIKLIYKMMQIAYMLKKEEQIKLFK